MYKEIEDKKKLLFQKKKPFYGSVSIPSKKLVPLEKNIDYLQEFRKKNEIKKVNQFNDDNKSDKWDKILKNKNNSIFDNVQKVKNEVNLIDNKLSQAEEFLKINGGIKNNPEIGQKVSNMLIDSIRAKLSLITLNKESEAIKKEKIKARLNSVDNISKKGNVTLVDRQSDNYI